MGASLEPRQAAVPIISRVKLLFKYTHLVPSKGKLSSIGRLRDLKEVLKRLFKIRGWSAARADAVAEVVDN